MSRLPLVLALCAAAACVDDPALDTAPTAAPAPLTGVDGAVDQADRAFNPPQLSASDAERLAKALDDALDDD